MAAGIGISIATKLIEVLGTEIIQDVCQMWDYKSQLEELKESVLTIQKVLLDADAKRELSHEEHDYISKLKDVVYDADDLFDEIRTLAELKQLKSLNKVDKIIAKVRSIFSSKNSVVQAYKRSREVKDIKTRLDSIVDNHKKFGFSVDYKPIVRRREETCSYVDVKDIIGRDKDKEAIMNMLLDPSGNEDFCFLTIVGGGGLGKTALAQLVFNDEKIRNEFPCRLWVCVSDQDGEQFDVKAILCKILELVTQRKPDMNSSMELVQNQFQNSFRGKKFFLVLDDVWNEDRHKWGNLRKFLMLGAEGSKIIVTTRSEKTSGIIGNKQAYNLDGLSHENSWCLFEMSAFVKEEKHCQLVDIGKKIVRKCHRNPLALKVVGSLLYGQDLSKWQSIEKSGLTEISLGSDEIFSVLKLSYNNLTPSLKSCFSYCAVFPKDYEMCKEMLIGQWMAQGYVVSLDGGQTVEEAAEEYFLILMRRCFFQDVKKDKYGDVMSVKIHDLMHDVAKEVAKEEISVVTFDTNNLENNVRHVNIVGDGFSKMSLSCNRIRSYICRHNKEHIMDKIVENWTALRVVDLSQSSVGSLLDSVDKLLLLRYLNLSGNVVLTSLPDSITRLYNLQTLILRGCKKLRELPKNFCNLINLRHLDIHECKELIGVPLGIDKLTNLRVLPFFVAGSDDELKMLQGFTKLQGSMHITIRKNYRHVDGVNDIGGCLKRMKNLRNNSIKFDYCIDPEGLVGKLEPPPNIQGLILENYYGRTIPWSTISLRCLVDLQITDSWKLKQIPVLSKLPHLKSLILRWLHALEFMENEMSSGGTDTEAAEFFPSLESLEMHYLYELKGWWNGDEDLRFGLRFPRLSYMSIHECPKLTSFAPCPSLEKFPEHELPCLHKLDIRGCRNMISNIVCPNLVRLKLDDSSDRLQITCGNSQDEAVKLREVNIDKVGHLKPLPTNCLTELIIDGDRNIESFSEIEEKFQKCASSLRTLDVRFYDLRSLRGLEHLTALEELKLLRNDSLSISGEDEEPWKSFHSLRKLEFHSLTIVSLPKGIRYLTSLQTLVISYCPGIKSLPEGMKDLTALKKLSISLCSELIKRCNKSNGEDFPKIRHIPEIDI